MNARTFTIKSRLFVVLTAFAAMLHTPLVNAENYRAGLLLEKYQAAYSGSFAQFTKNIAVTAKHVGVKDGVLAGECVDIEFFKHKGEPLSWQAAPTKDTAISALGYARNNRLEMEQIAETGQLLAAKEVRLCNTRYYMLVHTAPTQDGMSGGPVFDTKTGNAIGITKGKLTEGEMAGAGVFVPFEVILAVWKEGLKSGAISPEFANE